MGAGPSRSRSVYSKAENNTTYASLPHSTYSTMDSDVVSHTWFVDKFSESAEETGECIETQMFGGGRTRSRWYMQLFPNGEDDENNISVFIGSDNVETTRARISVTVTDKAQRRLREVVTSDWTDLKYRTSIGWSRLLQRDQVLPLTDDTLVISATITLDPKRLNSSRLSAESEALMNRDMAHRSLISDLDAALQDDETADLTISVRSEQDVEKFHAHRAILAARSPVFRAMFSTRMLELERLCITIDDISPEAFRALLRYFYTTDSGDLPRLALELFAAADKYEVVELKRECAASISANLAVDNVCIALVLADMHSDDELKADAVKFIKENTAQVHATNGFKSGLLSHPKLMAELL